jgi:hypothetical protein
MRFVRSDVRGLIVSHKSDHGPSHRRDSALQRQRSLEFNFRGIFGVVRFSTFATISARNAESTPSMTSSALVIIEVGTGRDQYLATTGPPKR